MSHTRWSSVVRRPLRWDSATVRGFGARLRSMDHGPRTTDPTRRGFTLIEIMVVIIIISLVAVATLPVVVPSMQQSQISAAARELQAELSARRDEAVRTNTPRGIRFIPENFDPLEYNGKPFYGKRLISRKYIAIEQGPDYAEGLVRRYFDSSLSPPQLPGPVIIGRNYFPPPPPFVPASLPGCPDPYPRSPVKGVDVLYPYLVIHEEKVGAYGIPNSPTSWYFNLRQGDKIRLNDSGKLYTIAGPLGNPTEPGSFTHDRFINFGSTYSSIPGNFAYEFLYLVDGIDNDKDGYTDEGFDGIDNDGDGIIDPGFNGIDDDGNGLIDDFPELFLHRTSGGGFIYPGCPGPLGTPWPPPPTGPQPPTTYTRGYPNEWEPEEFGPTSDSRYPNDPNKAGEETNGISYTVLRRPVPSPGAREINLPTGTVLDLTTFDADEIPFPNSVGLPYMPERSRLPVDPNTGYVDILISPGGQVIQQTANANPAPPNQMPFYHFWLADDGDVLDPFPVTASPGPPFLLPMLSTAGDDTYTPALPSVGPYPGGIPTLKGSRRLVTLNTQSGKIATNSVETFYTNNTSHPFKAAEAGQKEEP